MKQVGTTTVTVIASLFGLFLVVFVSLIILLQSEQFFHWMSRNLSKITPVTLVLSSAKIKWSQGVDLKGIHLLVQSENDKQLEIKIDELQAQYNLKDLILGRPSNFYFLLKDTSITGQMVMAPQTETQVSQKPGPGALKTLQNLIEHSWVQIEKGEFVFQNFMMDAEFKLGAQYSKVIIPPSTAHFDFTLKQNNLQFMLGTRIPLEIGKMAQLNVIQQADGEQKLSAHWSLLVDQGVTIQYTPGPVSPNKDKVSSQWKYQWKNPQAALKLKDVEYTGKLGNQHVSAGLKSFELTGDVLAEAGAQSLLQVEPHMMQAFKGKYQFQLQSLALSMQDQQNPAQKVSLSRLGGISQLTEETAGMGIALTLQGESAQWNDLKREGFQLQSQMQLAQNFEKLSAQLQLFDKLKVQTPVLQLELEQNLKEKLVGNARFDFKLLPQTLSAASQKLLFNMGFLKSQVQVQWQALQDLPPQQSFSLEPYLAATYDYQATGSLIQQQASSMLAFAPIQLALQGQAQGQNQVRGELNLRGDFVRLSTLTLPKMEIKGDWVANLDAKNLALSVALQSAQQALADAALDVNYAEPKKLKSKIKLSGLTHHLPTEIYSSDLRAKFGDFKATSEWSLALGESQNFQFTASLTQHVLKSSTPLLVFGDPVLMKGELNLQQKDLDLQLTANLGEAKFPPAILGQNHQMIFKVVAPQFLRDGLASAFHVDLQVAQERLRVLDKGQIITGIRGLMSHCQIHAHQQKWKLQGCQASIGSDTLRAHLRGEGDHQKKSLELHGDLRLVANTELREFFGANAVGSLTVPWRLNMQNYEDMSFVGRIRAQGFGFVKNNMGILGMNGELPFSEALWLRKGKFEFQKVLSRNPFERVDYDRLEPLLLGRRSLQIDKLVFHELEYGPLEGHFSLEQNLFIAHRFNADLRGGNVVGESYIDAYPSSLQFGLLTRFSGLSGAELLPQKFWGRKKPSAKAMSGRTALVVDFNREVINGRVDVTEIGKEQVLSMINALDPQYENEKMNLARMGLSAAYPTYLGLGFNQGFMDLSLRISGVLNASYTMNSLPLLTFISLPIKNIKNKYLTFFSE